MVMLSDLTYPSFSEGFGDEIPPRFGGPSPKYIFLRDAKKFLRQIAKGIPGKAKVKSNPGGIAVPGEAYLSSSEDGRVLFVCVVFSYEKKHAVLYWRIGKERQATDGTNHWVEESTETPQGFIQRLRGIWALA